MDALARIVGAAHVERDVVVGDAGVAGVPATLVRPGTAAQVAEVVAWCYAHDVPIVPVGGAVRKDVAGYDLRALLTGSEGTLGIVTAAWLRLTPAPAAQLVVVAAYADAAAGCAAILRVLASGVVPAALEFFDEGAVGAAGASFPLGTLGGFVVIAEADGSVAEAAPG